MYWADHAPPHLHAVYSGEEAKFAILTGELIEGDIARRTARIVREWIALRRKVDPDAVFASDMARRLELL